MEVLNSVLEHIIKSLFRIENRETDIIANSGILPEAQYRKKVITPIAMQKGEFNKESVWNGRTFDSER